MLQYLRECNTVMPVMAPDAKFEKMDISYLLETIAEARGDFIKATDALESFAKEYGLDGKYDSFNPENLQKNYIDASRQIFDLSQKLQDAAWNMQRTLNNLEESKHLCNSEPYKVI